MENSIPTSITMGDREKWLSKWLKGRNYTLDSRDRRRTFLHIYFFTVKAAYGDEWAAYLTRKRNSSLVNPIDTASLDGSIRVWSMPTYIYNKYTNERIIQLLGITDAEVEDLRIGHNKKEKEARKERNIQRRERNAEILILRADGLTQKEIANKLSISISTVKRVIRDGRELLKGSQLTITDAIREKEALTEFVSPTAENLYTLYKTETENAPSNEFELALSRLQLSKSNIFIQGSAGTGKTTLINEYLSSLPQEERKSVLLTAPTGKAADLIDGVTIHKAFELPKCVQTQDEINKIPQMLKSIKTVIIDEISMVRCDLFEKVMQILEYAKQTTGQNIRLVVMGDFGQLNPVVTQTDKAILGRFYPDIKSYFAFSSPKWQEAGFETIVLHLVKRQRDAEYIEYLNGIKYGRIADIDWFICNASPFIRSKPVFLCTTRKRVEEYNNQALSHFDESELKTYCAEANGTLTYDLPCPVKLTVGIGVRIMTVCNSSKYKNGNLGTVKVISDDSITVRLDNGKTVSVKQKAFELDNGTVYKQFPLVLAYAITVHRAQGSTFESVAIVCNDDFFDTGMLYTALSRCPDITNVTFFGRLKTNDLKIDAEALRMTIEQK